MWTKREMLLATAVAATAVWGMSNSGARAADAERLEYKCIESSPSAEAAQTVLQQTAKDGWELVTAATPAQTAQDSHRVNSFAIWCLRRHH